MPFRISKRLLITGAAGALGRQLRSRLAGIAPAIRLSDVVAMDRAAQGEEVVTCDLADASSVAALCRDVDAIVHLGGRSNEAKWDIIHKSNILGAINLWEGAREAGVKRILFASSNHAIGLYRRAQRIDHAAEPRSDSRYGLSKAFGEDIARLYAYKHGIAGFCMRIGSCFPEPKDMRMLSTWQSYPDFERLVRVGLGADYVFEIVYGVSRNTRSWWDNANAYRLGYDPQDNAESFAAKVAGMEAANPMDATFQGGGFVSPEFTADPAQIP
jgi:uronate dehydrogenase